MFWRSDHLIFLGNWESLGLEHGLELGLGLEHGLDHGLEHELGLGLGLGLGSKHLIFFAVVGISWMDTVATVAGQIELNAELRLSVHRVELSVLSFDFSSLIYFYQLLEIERTHWVSYKIIVSIGDNYHDPRLLLHKTCHFVNLSSFHHQLCCDVRYLLGHWTLIAPTTIITTITIITIITILINWASDIIPLCW